MKDDLSAKYTKLFNYLKVGKDEWLQRAIESEELYYSDVEGTFTQYTRKQLEELRRKYDINVSVNILLPIVEQTISLLVNPNPSVRIIPVGLEDKDIAYLLNDIFVKIWQVSHAAIELEMALTDSVITGSGFMIVEPVDVYDSNKFKIKISHVPYTDVFVDPASRKWDLSDASVICIAKPAKLSYAMDVYGISESDSSALSMEQAIEDPAFRAYNMAFTDDKDKIVWVKDFYEKVIRTGTVEVKGVNIFYKKPVIRRTIQVGNKIVYQADLPIDEYPIVHFPFLHRRSNRTYGLIHYLIDLQRLENKSLGLTIHNAQLGSHLRYMAPEGAIVDKTKWENEASTPGVILEYRPDPNLPNAGTPQVVSPEPLNQAFFTIFNSSIQLAEYVSGMYGVVLGNSNKSPDVYSTVASLQGMGVQRIKNKARKYDLQIGRIAKIALKYAQLFLPRDIIARYVSDERKLLAIQKLNDLLTVDFDVETSSNPSMPTTRQIAAQMLAQVATNIGEPHLALALLEEVILLMDLPEADRILEKVSALNSMQERVAQLTALIQEQNNTISRMRSRMDRLQMDVERFKARAKAKGKDVEEEETTESNEVSETEEGIAEGIKLE